jgi:hypothetical protein
MLSVSRLSIELGGLIKRCNQSNHSFLEGNNTISELTASRATPSSPSRQLHVIPTGSPRSRTDEKVRVMRVHSSIRPAYAYPKFQNRLTLASLSASTNPCGPLMVTLWP